MNYLLDTCTLSDYLRREKKVVKNLHSHRSNRIHVSVITQYEIQFGLLNKPSLFSGYREQLSELYSKANIIGIDDQIAHSAAGIKFDLKKAGASIGDPDILIAATAIVNHLTVVTSNLKHFSRIEGLTIEDWK